MKVVGEAKIAGHLAYEVLDFQAYIKPNEPGSQVVTRDQLEGRIELRNVSFKYPSRADLTILDNFSGVFEAGKTTALVGPSGCGKSTIIQLLERFYDATSGDVLIDGRNIKSLNLRSFR